MSSRHAPPRRLLIVTLIAASLVLGVLGPTAQADDKARKRSVDKKISQLRGDLEDTSRRLENAINALHQAESKLKSAQAHVAKVRGQLAAAQARDAMLAGKLRLAVAEVDRAEKEIAATQAKITGTQRVIGRMARSSYQEGSYAELAVVLNSESPDDFATKLVLVQDALRSQGNVLTNLADDKADLAAQRATLDAKRAQIAAMKHEQEKLVARIKGLEQAAIAAQRQVESLVAARAGAVSAVQRERDAERTRLAAAQAQSQALARSIAIAAARAAARARLRSRPVAARGSSGGGGSGRGGSGMAWPANGRISTYAGYRINPVTGNPSCHSGIDIAPGYGAPIFAAASGVVVATTYTAWDGNTTIIAHGGGMTTWYAHQDSFGVSVGQRVSRGQVIGHVGSSGFATGPHLHFNIVLGETAYDPMGWYGGPMRTVASLCPNGPSPVL
ncbi:MAG: murein hydrolase activator EnvC family protein [Actinomycetes bacterium]